MRQNNSAFALAFERLDQVQQEGVITVSGGWDAILKTIEFIMRWGQPVRPSFRGERRIGNSKVESFE